MKKEERNQETTVRKRKKKLITVPKKKSKQKPEIKAKEKQQKKYVSKKRLKARRKFVLITSLVLILGITLTVLSYTVFFPIKKIEIIGNEKYKTEEIIKLLGVVKGDNLLLASENRAEKLLKQELNYIESIEFNRKIPFTLSVQVKEYEVFAQIKQNNQYYKISSSGRLLEKSIKAKSDSPIVTGVKVDNIKVGESLDLENESQKISKIDDVIKAFENNGINGVTLINIKDVQDIRVTYKDRIVMLLGSSSNLDKKLVHAKATLEAKGNTKESGTLNLSRIPSAKNEASFIPRELEAEEMAKIKK